jgi:hypothetical protein
MRGRWTVTLVAAFLATGLVKAQSGDTRVLYTAGKEAAQDGGQPQPAPLAPHAGVPADDHGAVCQTSEWSEEPKAPQGRLWGSADALLWWIKNSHTPPLVSTGPPGSGAILGQGGQTVFGGSVDNEGRLGGRFTVGGWLDCDGTSGLEASYLFLGSRGVDFIAGSNGALGTPALGRPFFNALANAEDSQLVVGSVAARLSSRLQGAELNGVHGFCCCDGCGRMEFLAGFRYLELQEGLGIGEIFQVPPTVGTIGGTTLVLNDQFDAANHFYGGQVGARGCYRMGKLDVDASVKVALGENQERVDIGGSTGIVPPGGTPTVLRGGLLALSSNIGRYNHDSFAVLPEVGVNVGYQVTCSLRVYAGYTFLYLSDAVRPGDQVDRVINPTLLPTNPPTGGLIGPARPSFTFKETDFWAQGVHVGVEFQF